MKRGHLLQTSYWATAAASAALAASAAAGSSAPPPGLVANRLAVERVYAAHRLNGDPASSQSVSPALAESLVRLDLKKEGVLLRVYGVTVIGPMVQTEVERIDATTRASETLAEVKAALGNDPARFAEMVAKPIVVERLLRSRFNEDETIHAPERQCAVAARLRLLAVREGDFAARLAVLKADQEGEVQEPVQWELAPHAASQAPMPAISGPTRAIASSGAYLNEATLQAAQVLSSPEAELTAGKPKFYFDDLPADLQRVLRVQLRQPGDVSAVIEMPGMFQVFLAKELASNRLVVAIFTVHKRSYEDWLAAQPDA